MFNRILVIGAGHIGQAIVHLLSGAGDQVTIVDRDLARANRVAAGARAALGRNVTAQTLDATNEESLRTTIDGFDAVVNALPYRYAAPVARAAAAVGAHCFDLTEDVESTRAIRAIAPGARSVLMPQCGLAPGIIGIVGSALLSQFDRAVSLKLRVGALPRYPSNALRYNLTWSTEGLINEYCNPCDAIVDGHVVKTAAMEGYERFVLDGVEYEAFNTSGGLGTLCETLEGSVRSLDYKSIRYPGHHSIIRVLLDDMGLRSRRDLLAQIFDAAIARTEQDVVVIFASAIGYRGDVLMERSWSHRVESMTLAGLPMTAIQATTAIGVCAALDMVREGSLPQRGFIGQQQVPLERFLANRFGSMIAPRVASSGRNGAQSDDTRSDLQMHAH